MVGCVVITTLARYFMTIRGGGRIVLRSSTPGPYFSPPNVRQSSPLSCTTTPTTPILRPRPNTAPILRPYPHTPPILPILGPLLPILRPHHTTPHHTTTPTIRPLHSTTTPLPPIPRPTPHTQTPISPLLSPVSPNSPIKATRAPTSDILPH